MLTKYYMDFSFTDTLYEGDQDGYKSFLKVSQEEFATDFETMKDALRNNNAQGFSDIKHKFTTRLSTFRLESLEAFLQSISNAFKSESVTLDTELTLEELEIHIKGIMKMLEEKNNAL
ncbi:hypothetical protein [Algivirga pacifica]|uniref:HPt domain-containing protein n=1 Tax=Algivirga pacifica TaxID=1162670 RepID=A0ABP9D5P6_9BACT